MEKNKRRGVLNWFRTLKLWKKILCTFILSAILPLIAVQSIMIYVNATSVKEKVDELMVNELVQMAERVELTLEVYSNLVYQLSSDNQIIDNINIRLNEGDADTEVAGWGIYDRVRQYDISAEGIKCVSIILKDGQHLTYDFESASTVQSIWNEYEDLREITPYKEAQKTSGIVVTPTMWHDVSGKNRSLFHISKKIYDYEEPEKGAVGTVVMSVESRVLEHICTVDYEHDPKQEHNVNFIVDKKGYILSYPDAHYTGTTIHTKQTIEEFVQSTGQLEGKKTASNKYEDKKLGWIFYNVYDKTHMLNSIWDSLKFTISVVVLFTVFAVIMIIFMINPIKKSLHSLMQGIRKVQDGNLDVKIDEEAADEFGEIARSFNTMTGRLQELFREVTDAAGKQREAEIRALEAQINPHFLYNTLDSINWMAIDKGEHEISRMLRDLGVILRYSVNKSNQIAQIEEVTDWLEKYIELQQLRFNHSFSFELFVEEEAKKVKIYKLLLQPFIENAIVHGFKGIVSGGILRVSMLLSEEGDMLHVIVEDNGNGMTPEQVKKYNNKEMVLSSEEQGIGLENSFTRMYMYYGEDADWNVSSIPRRGTVITLKIPIKERADHENCNSRG